MKKLENLKEFQLKNEMSEIKMGGQSVRVSGSYIINGSQYSYDGVQWGTGFNDGSSVTIEGTGGGSSSTSYKNDFTGTINVDGRINANTWTGVSI